MTQIETFYKYEAYIYTILDEYTLPSGVEYLDVIQEGYAILLKYIKNYSPDKVNTPFSTWIYNQLRREISIYVSRLKEDFSLSYFLLQQESILRTHMNKNPEKDPYEFSKFLSGKEATVKTILNFYSLKSTISSKDSFIPDGVETELPIASRFPSQEDEIILQEETTWISSVFEKLVEGLNTNQREILEIVLRGDKTYAEIGEERGVTRQQIGNVIFSCKNRLKKIVMDTREQTLYLVA